MAGTCRKGISSGQGLWLGQPLAMVTLPQLLAACPIDHHHPTWWLHRTWAPIWMFKEGRGGGSKAGASRGPLQCLLQAGKVTQELPQGPQAKAEGFLGRIQPEAASQQGQWGFNPRIHLLHHPRPGWTRVWVWLTLVAAGLDLEPLEDPFQHQPFPDPSLLPSPDGEGGGDAGDPAPQLAGQRLPRHHHRPDR